MKTLDQHNAERWDTFRNLTEMDKPRPNSIGCPGCGAELIDSCPQITLTSNPPQKNIHCEHCGYRGYRLA